MFDMTHPASISKLGPEFDEFLFAQIGDDGNGMLLSVVSALARLGIDPWQEAATLARLPARTATDRLASLIAALPGGPSAPRDPGTIAADLITRLPRQVRGNIRTKLHGIGETTSSRVVMCVVCIYVISVVFILAAQWMAIRLQLPAGPEKAQSAPSSAAPGQQTPPSIHQ